jgi:hypothetical protein
MKTFEYNFDDLPLVIENGFEACEVAGSAEVSYSSDGEWSVESIHFDGNKRNHYTLEQLYEAQKTNAPLPHWTRQSVELDRGTPIFSIIHDRLENEWRERVQDAVRQQIEDDRIQAADDAADYAYERLRERMMEAE